MWYTPTTPYLIRLYRNKDGKAVCDTVKTYPEGTISSSAQQLNEVLCHVRDNFTSGSYGMIFSSHATGYLPSGYYTNPNGYKFKKSAMLRSRGIPAPVPYIEPDFDPSLPMVKSIGQDQVGKNPLFYLLVSRICWLMVVTVLRLVWQLIFHHTT